MTKRNLDIIGQRIKELRTEKKMSQAKLGCILSVSQDTISLWENCKSVPSADIIIELAEIFDVSCDYILGIENC